MRTTHRNKPDFRLQPIVLAIHLALAGAAMADPSTNALPTGGQVVSGQATIQQQGGNMDIQQGTPSAALDWQTFNIGAQAQVNFHQPDVNSVALNRVAVGNASVIEGRLTANGQVFLVNPSGVLFGRGAQVDVGGLVATTMNISNKDFAAGNYRFSRDGSVGEVVNQGVIKARDGGYVALVAATLLNEGTLQANGGGTVALAAGDGATLQFNGGNLVNIQVDPATVKTLIENKQLIQAEGGRVLMTAMAASRLQGAVINNAGAVEANSITSEGGVIRLTGADEITNTGTLDASGKTAGGTVEITAAGTVGADSSGQSLSAIHQSGIVKADSSAGHGGTITLSAHDEIDNTGTLDASGATAGGTVEISAADTVGDSSAQSLSTLHQSGIVKASSSAGHGGTITLTANDEIDNTGTLDASGATAGGTVDMEADTIGADSSGQPPSLVRQAGIVKADALSGKGGKIVLTGEHLQLDKDSLTTATGTSGGGEIYAGGGKHGSPLPLAGEGSGVRAKNAKSTRVETGAVLDASATDSGDGGIIVAWGDDAARAYGEFRANGGPNGGNGGLVETSGHWLDVDGIKVDAKAPQGKGGEWLLDPLSVSIIHGIIGQETGGTGVNPVTGGTWLPVPDPQGSQITDALINSALDQGTTVTITTFGAGLDTGDISVQGDSFVNHTAGGIATLNLTADGGITLITGSRITGNAANPLNVLLETGHGIDPSVGARITMDPTTTISTGGGTLTLNTGFSGVTPDGTMSISGTLNSGGNTLSLISHATSGGDGSITVNNDGILLSGVGLLGITANAGNIANGGTANIINNGSIQSGGTNITLATNAGGGQHGDISTVAGSSIQSGGGIVRLNAVSGNRGFATINHSGNIDSGGGNIFLTTDASTDIGTKLGSATITTITDSTIISNGGEINLWTDINSTIHKGAILLSGGNLISNNGKITIGGGSNGTGPADATFDSSNAGIRTQNSMTIDSGDGDISLNGLASSNSRAGLEFSGSQTTLTATGGGTITILGTNEGTSRGWSPFGATNISTVNGKISITGKTASTTNTGIGVASNSSNAISITSTTGEITLDGSAGIGGRDINFAGTGQIQILTNSSSTTTGNIRVDATGVAGGINFAAATTPSLIQTNSSQANQGNITLNAGVGNLSYIGNINAAGTNGRVVLQSNNNVTIGNENPLVNSSITSHETITTAGQQAILLRADNDGNDSGALTLNRTAVSSNGGNITLRGRNVSGLVPNNSVDSGDAIIILDALGGTAGYLGSLTSTNPSASASAITVRNATTATLGNINATAGTVVLGEIGLNAITGAVTQTGIINANTLIGNTTNTVTLGGLNTLTNLGAFTNVGAFLLNDDAGGLNVTGLVTNGGLPGATARIDTKDGTLALTGSVIGNGVTLTTTTTGIASAITLAGGNVTGGTGGVALNSAESIGHSSGTVSGDLVTFNSATGISLTGTAAVTAAVGDVVFNSTAGGTSQAAGTAITATAGDVVFNSTAGGVTQTGGTLTALAGGLELRGAGVFSLTAGANNVTRLAAGITGAGGSIDYRNTVALTIGQVNSTQGITTSNQAATLHTGGNLIITNNVDVGTGTLTLGTSASPVGGNITQAGIINAGSLLGFTTGLVTLGSGNTLTNLGNFSTNGTFTLNDADGGLTVTGAVSTNNLGTASITTTGGNLALTTGSVSGSNVILTTTNAVTTGTGNSIALGGNVSSGSGTVTLTSAADISQSGGNVTAGILTGTAVINGTATGQASLASLGNQIDNLDLFTTAAGFTLVDANGGLNVTGAVTGGTGLASITTTGGNLVVDGTALNTGSVAGNGVNLRTNTTGDITLNGAVNGNLGTVALNSAGLIGQSATGIITAGTLTGGAATTAILELANVIANLNVFTTGGNFSLTDTTALNINGAVTSGGNVTLNSTAGGVAEIAGGSIIGTGIGTGLQLLGTGPFNLNQNGNNVTTLAANTSGGAITYRDADALVVGSVNGTVGMTSTNQAVTLTAGGNLSINNDLDAGSGAVNLTTTAGGNIIGAGGKITTVDTAVNGGLTLDAAGGIGVIDGIGKPVLTSTDGTAPGLTPLNLISHGSSGLPRAGNIILTEDNSLSTSRVHVTTVGASATNRYLIKLTTLANNTWTIDGPYGDAVNFWTLSAPNSSIVNGSGGLVSAYTLTLDAGVAIGATGNPITTAAPFINANSNGSALGGAAGGIWLSNNQATTLTALSNTVNGITSGPIDVENTAGLLTVGAVSDDTLPPIVTLGRVTSQFNAVYLHNQNAGITLNGVVTGSSATDAVTISTGTVFTNNAGANAVVANAGRWIVFSNRPQDDTFNGLQSLQGAVLQNALWHSTYPNNPPVGSVTGNRFMFAYQPTVTLTAGDLTKIYGEDKTAEVAVVPITYAEFFNGNGASTAFVQDNSANAFGGTLGTTTSLGSPAKANVKPGVFPANSYDIDINTGTFASTNGNKLTTAIGHLTIQAKAVGLIAAPVSKVYDAGLGYITQQSDLDALTAQLGVAGDTVTAATIAYLNPNFGLGNKAVTLGGVAV
ncbi:MAG: filamentous hemagglutinin N-terminal domain-containing protein, partial [Proteobacteria bacterium]|nr:filamentous hemagglutinin N-terminal domain-containing protein [Pseudomonadota bacterium]